MTLLRSIGNGLQERIERLVYLVDTTPILLRWLWYVVMPYCFWTVVVYLWFMEFGQVILTAIVLLVATAFLERWRWGLVFFSVLSGSVWVFGADNRPYAAMVTLAAVGLAAMFTLPRAPDVA